MKTPFASMALVIFGSFIGSLAMVFVKSGAGRLELSLRSALSNWRLVVGVAGFCLSSFFFVLGLREGQLTILYPMVAVGYIFTLFWSRLFFGEALTKGKFAAIGLILVGLVLLQFGNK